jgi:uncharacterized OsmC-like protein
MSAHYVQLLDLKNGEAIFPGSVDLLKVFLKEQSRANIKLKSKVASQYGALAAKAYKPVQLLLNSLIGCSSF